MKVLALDPISYAAAPTTRGGIERTVLEAAITAAVKKSGASCAPFVGVIVERVVARNASDQANWTVKGIKFGTSDREQCSSALSVIVERLKREFEITD
jgi:hypothetical protein